LKIYQVRTEMSDTEPGHSYDRFNVAADGFAGAVEKANRKLANDRKHTKRVPERIQDITLIAASHEN
jgi:hypothetical protein